MNNNNDSKPDKLDGEEYVLYWLDLKNLLRQLIHLDQCHIEDHLNSHLRLTRHHNLLIPSNCVDYYTTNREEIINRNNWGREGGKSMNLFCIWVTNSMWDIFQLKEGNSMISWWRSWKKNELIVMNERWNVFKNNASYLHPIR